MDKPDLSPNFTVEDIRKLREYNSEKRKNMTYDEYWADVEKGANEALRQMGEMKDKALAN